MSSLQQLVNILKIIDDENFEQYQPKLLQPELREAYGYLRDHTFSNANELLKCFHSALYLEMKISSYPHSISSVSTSISLFALIEKEFFEGDIELSEIVEACEKYDAVFNGQYRRKDDYSYPNKKVALRVNKYFGYFENQQYLQHLFKNLDVAAKKRWLSYQERSHSLSREQKLQNYNFFVQELKPYCEMKKIDKHFLELISLEIDFPLEMMEDELYAEFINWIDSVTFSNKYVLYKSLIGKGKVIKALKAKLHAVLYDESGRLSI